MRKFYEWIVEHTKTVLTAFLVLTVLSIFMKDLVAVDYDINDYLPEDAPSTVALDVMEEEFEGGIPNARVMINDLTIPQALEYKEKLKQVDGVSEVTWLDDAADIHVPLNTIDRDTLETYYKDNAALFTVTIDENKRIQAVEDIRALIGEDNAMTGSAVSTAVATTSTVKEVMMISAFAVLFVLIVLLITTPSWIEPLIVLGGLGVAIAINSGTNLIFGRISFVTNAAGNILQLAVSLDYSVFLIHRFEECRLENPDAKSAMVDALMKSTTSILSSGLTTVIGFLALVLMQFRIGPDLGLALAKGVALSLITVFVFMPDLILVTYRLLDKTRHRELSWLGQAGAPVDDSNGLCIFGNLYSGLPGIQPKRLLLRSQPHLRCADTAGCRYCRNRGCIWAERHLCADGSEQQHRNRKGAFGQSARAAAGDQHHLLCGCSRG